jgi:hypothetical protein
VINVKFAKLVVILLFPGLIFAHGPTRQKVSESVTISMGMSEAWALISDLRNIGRWHSLYKSIENKGEDPQPLSMFSRKSGVVQILTLDSEKKLFKYRLKKPGEIPVNNYSARVRLEAGGPGKVKITYKGAFYRKFLNNDPPPEENDEAAMAAVSKMYKETLKKFEKNLVSK